MSNPSQRKSGSFFIDLAKQNNLEVSPENGKNAQVTGTLPNGKKTTILIPDRPMSDGAELNVREWFMRLGIVIVVMFLVILLSLVL